MSERVKGSNVIELKKMAIINLVFYFEGLMVVTGSLIMNMAILIAHCRGNRKY